MELVLLRHFHSMGNENSENYHLYGDEHVPLSEKGKSQVPAAAEQLDRILKEHNITKPEKVVILTSPFQRAKESYQLIKEHSQHEWLKEKDAVEKSWLGEMHSGRAWDLSAEEREALYSGHFEAFNQKIVKGETDIKYPYGTTVDENYEAVKKVDLPEMLENYKQQGVKLVLCASHQIKCNVIRSILCDEQKQDIIIGKRLGNGALLRLSMNEKGEFSEPVIEHGEYKEFDSKKWENAEKPQPADLANIAPTKQIRHMLLKSSFPDGVLGYQDPQKCDTTSPLVTDYSPASPLERIKEEIRKGQEEIKSPLIHR